MRIKKFATKHRTLGYSLIFVVLFTLSSFSSRGNVPEEKMNVLIISDDLTTTALSGYENTMCRTPNIDKLASEGMLYTHAYCQYPVCGPSRASLMFGYYLSATQTTG